MTIWKFPLKITDFQKVAMPAYSKILSVQAQNGQLCLWAMVDETAPTPTWSRKIEIFGIGNPMPLHPTFPATEQPRTFIGTVQLDGFVWHVFERMNIGNPNW